MKPVHNLAEVRTPNGSRISLHEHDGEFFLRQDGRQLMTTTSTSSELQLADVACGSRGAKGEYRVLIGGLGLGFSLKRVLELVGSEAIVEVSELLPEVVSWNREFLMKVNGRLLDDPRVKVLTRDVFEVMSSSGPSRYDAILLDVDNGPTSMVQPQNARLYKRSGFAKIRKALKQGGRVAFWSAEPEPLFMRQLGDAGFRVNEFPARAHERAKRFAHRIYVGEKV